MKVHKLMEQKLMKETVFAFIDRKKYDAFRKEKKTPVYVLYILKVI